MSKPKPSEQVLGEQLGKAIRWIAGVIFLVVLVVSGAVYGGGSNPVGILLAIPTLIGTGIGCLVLAALGAICENVAVMRRLREQQE